MDVETSYALAGAIYILEIGLLVAVIADLSAGTAETSGHALLAGLFLLEPAPNASALALAVGLPLILGITLQAGALHIAGEAPHWALDAHILDLLVLLHAPAFAGGGVGFPVVACVAEGALDAVGALQAALDVARPALLAVVLVVARDAPAPAVGVPVGAHFALLARVSFQACDAVRRGFRALLAHALVIDELCGLADAEPIGQDQALLALSTLVVGSA